MLNRVVLTGRLTRDPELTYTQSGPPVLRFSIAVDRQFKNRETGRRDADFINCVIWRTSAENFARFTHKGALVGLDGRLSTSNYENQQGQRVYRTEVTVENFALLEPRSANNGNGGYNGGGYNNGGNGFNNQGQSFGNNAYGNSGNFGAAPQNNFGGSPAPADQSYNGNFNQPQGGVFKQGPTQIDADSLPFSKDNDTTPAAGDNGAVNIDDNAAFSANPGSGSASSASDADGMPSSDDLPF